MITQELVAYMQAERAKGTPIETVRKNLISQGWTMVDVTEAERLAGPAPMAQPISQFQSKIPDTALEPTGVPAFTKMPTREEMLMRGTTTTSTVQPVIVRKKQRLGVWIVLFVLLLVLAGGAYAFAQGMIPLPGKANAFFNSKEATSVTFDITFTLDGSGMKSFQEEVGVTADRAVFRMTGSSDSSDINARKLDATFTLDAGETAASFDMRVLDTTLYARLTKAPNLGLFSLDDFLNKWYSFDYEEGSPLIPIPTDSPAFDSLTEEQKEEIGRITKESHVVHSHRDLLPKNVDGTFVWHYTFNIDKEGTKKYLTDLATYLNSQNKSDAIPVNQEEISMAVNAITDLRGEAWVGVLDGLPYKFSADMSVQPEKDSSETLRINTLATFTNWNKPVTIEAPLDATSIEDLIGGLFEGSSPITNATETGLQSSLASVRTAAELHYSDTGSYQGYCESSLYTDIVRTMQTTYPTAQPVCKTSASAWAASVQVLDTANYVCADSTGALTTTTGHPEDFTCAQ